jgi:hypothetical protein
MPLRMVTPVGGPSKSAVVGADPCCTPKVEVSCPIRTPLKSTQAFRRRRVVCAAGADEVGLT